MTNYDLIIIGGGPAGMAAATEAKAVGIKKILLIEQEKMLGGILRQCIHNGFGIKTFNEELTGPAFAQEYINIVSELDVDILTKTTVLNISDNRVLTLLNTDGAKQVKTKALIIANGCRERTRGAISTPGTRPANVYTAGHAQYLINTLGYKIGKRAFVLGSGDIGLIMARRLAWEGVEVLGIAELMPYSAGLKRNIVQCADDFNIPLYLSHTVKEIYGNDNLERITLVQVDENLKEIPGTEKDFEVDLLLYSVGLIPNNTIFKKLGIELSDITNGPIVNELMQTSKEWIFTCGNTLHVHDIVDMVVDESKNAAHGVAKYLRHSDKNIQRAKVSGANGIRYVVPQKVAISEIDNNIEFFMRSGKVFGNCHIVVTADGHKIAQFKRSFILPAEMEKVTIPKLLLIDDIKEIVIEVVEGEHE